MRVANLTVSVLIGVFLIVVGLAIGFIQLVFKTGNIQWVYYFIGAGVAVVTVSVIIALIKRKFGKW